MVGKKSIPGKNVSLVSYTSKSWHEFYYSFVPDPIMDATPYIYDYERVESAYKARMSDNTREYFAIVHDGKSIGQIYLKHIDLESKTSSFGIALADDSVKGRGFGTEAINLLINYAFRDLGLVTVFADTLLHNTRSQHVLKKVGFMFTHEDDMFKHYRIDQNQTKDL
jgi:RimJ/RimL family protein N-acetyltransferase